MQSAGRGRASRSAPQTPARSHLACGRQANHWWALSVLLAVLLVPVAAQAPATAAVPEETGKYYVVGPPVDGQRDYLYSIALRTLGNGNRFREIIELNRGREQPDGATFTDGVELAPGWILVLPKDADGPGVRTGRLPAIRPPAPRSTPSPSTPSPRAGSPSPTLPPPSPSLPPPSPGGAAPPPATAAPAGDPTAPADTTPWIQAAPSKLADAAPDLVRVGAGALALVLAVVAILVLPRRAYRMRSVTLDDGPWPPQRHHTPTPAELAANSDTPPAPPPAPPASPPDPPVSSPAPRASSPNPPPSPPDAPAGSAAAARPSPTVAVPMTPSPAPGRSTPAGPPPSARPDPAKPAALPDPGPGPASSTPPADWPPIAAPRSTASAAPPAAVPETPPGTPTTALPTTTSAAPVATERTTTGDEGGSARPALPGEGEVPYVRTNLATALGPILVRLVGVTTGPTTAAYAWLADDEQASAATVPLVLGRRGPWRLQIDLRRAPDVFTLVGVMDDCRRLAATYARQLREAGVGVAVVGDALGAEPPDGCRRLATWAAADDLGPEPYVVIGAGMPTDGGAGLPGLAAGSRGRCIPLVIGAVPYGRWSAQLGG